jgi:hypothetical protein
MLPIVGSQTVQPIGGNSSEFEPLNPTSLFLSLLSFSSFVSTKASSDLKLPRRRCRLLFPYCFNRRRSNWISSHKVSEKIQPDQPVSKTTTSGRESDVPGKDDRADVQLLTLSSNSQSNETASKSSFPPHQHSNRSHNTP